MSARFANIFKQPYPLYLEFSKTFPVIVGISLFVPIFLMLFKPFGLTGDDIVSRKFFLMGFGLINFLVLSFNVYILPRLFSSIFDEDKWNVGKEIAWLLWNVFACVSASAIFEFIQPDCPFTFTQLMQGYLQGFLVSVIPVSVVVLLVHMALLKSKLRRAEEATRKLETTREERSDEKLEFISETRTETLKIAPDDLLFIQSSDNYCTIVRQEDSQTQKTLIRSSLKRLEDQISFPFIMRCHRSFIVNLAKVYSVSGNANGYKLYLKKHAQPIPVARRFGKQVLQILERLSG